MTVVNSDRQEIDAGLPGVRLRRALPEEENAVVVLRRSSGWSGESVPQQFRAMAQGRREIWIAECDGYLVGTITLEWFSDDQELADGRTTAHISNLVVHPFYRRRGIARGLIAAIEQVARRRGCRHITIGVDFGNMYARDIYERLGYEHTRDLRQPWGMIHILRRALS